MADHAYVLEVWAAGITTTVWLNRWPAHRSSQPRGLAFQKKLNAWLLEGENLFEVEVAKHPSPEMRPELYVKIFKGAYDIEHTPEKPLFGFYWTAEEHPLEEEGMTRVFSHTMTMVKGSGRWAWEDARPFMPRDRDDIEQLVVSFHAALQARDTGRCVDMLRLKLQEMARSVDDPPQELVGQQQRYFDLLYFNAADWRLDPLDPTTLVLESSAMGRLVAIRGADGGAPIVGVAHGNPFTFDLTVTRVGTSWQIAR